MFATSIIYYSISISYIFKHARWFLNEKFRLYDLQITFDQVLKDYKS